MSESNNGSTNQDQNPTGGDNNQSTQEPVRNPEAVLAKNKELLGKLSDVNKKLEELSNWKKDRELDDKQKQGDLEGVITSLRDELATTKQELTDTKRGYASKSVEDQIKQAAISKGCVNADKLMKLLTKEQLSTVQVGDNFSVNKDDLTRLVDELEKEHSDIGLFKKTNVNINNVTGDLNKNLGDAKNKKIEEMSASEYQAYLSTVQFN